MLVNLGVVPYRPSFLKNDKTCKMSIEFLIFRIDHWHFMFMKENIVNLCITTAISWELNNWPYMHHIYNLYFYIYLVSVFCLSLYTCYWFCSSQFCKLGTFEDIKKADDFHKTPNTICRMSLPSLNVKWFC